MRWLPRAGVLLSLGMLVAGCSWLPDHRLDYQQATPGEKLALPAGLQMQDDVQAYGLPDQGSLLPEDQRGRFSVPLPPQLVSIKQEADDREVAGPAPDVNSVRSVMSSDGNGYPMIMIHARFAWAWEYVGTALQKSGIKVTDKDRAAGIYYVQLSRSRDIKDRDVQIKLSHTTNGIQVVTMDKKGTALLDKTQGRGILTRLYAEL